MPASDRAAAVPPVEMISIPASTRWRAKGTIPDLSETLISARAMGWFFCLDFAQRERAWSGLRSGIELVLAQLLAQRAAIDAEHLCCTRLVTTRMFEDSAQQRHFNFTQYELIQSGDVVPVDG